MKRVLIVLTALFSIVEVSAQQDAQFSQNMFINSAINPGASGIKGMHCFDLIAREQWFGFEGRPETGLLSYNGLVSNNFGMGAVLMYDKIGFENNINLKLNGSKHFNVGTNGGKLGIGLDVGMLQRSMSGIPRAVNQLDPSVNFANNPNDMGLDIGFGLFYYKEKGLYFGVSAQKLLPQKLNLGGAKPEIRQHVYISAGFKNHVNQNFVLKPNMLVKTDLTSTQMDLNLTAEFNNAVWLGASYRVTDAFIANVGFNYRKKDANDEPSGQPLKVGIAYDFTMQALKNKGTFTKWSDAGSVQEVNNNNRSIGSVELYIGYCIIPPPKPDFDIYTDPLFL
jgi:type IX secretion system PorP/SprF family membrane protein